MAERISHQFAYRKKRGFSVPIEDWLWTSDRKIKPSIKE
jgi:hypothetical protein